MKRFSENWEYLPLLPHCLLDAVKTVFPMQVLTM